MAPLDWMDAASSGAAAGEASGPGGGELEASILTGLNDEQREAVLHERGPLLILAGAGSGKTRVITRRIAWLVATGRARAGEVLALTFTNKAAKEMRTRVEALLPEDQTRGMWVSTFHAMCARVLRRDIEVLGGWTRDFTIYDTHDKNQLLKSITKDLGYDVQRYRPALLSSWVSEWKCERFSRSEDVEQEAFGGMDGQVFVAVRDRYEAAMRDNNALDFDDLLVRVLELFEREPGVRDAYAHRFRYVLVDEYQDTNHIQYLLTRHLSGAHGNLAVCGDPDQSIYAWRGADIRNILDFERDFGAGGEVRVVKLERNYRSTKAILDAAQAVIRCNVERREKELWTDATDCEPVRVLSCADENDEAGEIVRRIQDLSLRGIRPDGIAVFYRTNFMQRALERALRLGGVPYQVVGGPEFYQRREVRDLVAYLQLVANPRDDLAVRRVVNVPARGVGDKSLAELQGWAEERRGSLLDAVLSEEARGRIRGRARKGLAAFAELCLRLRDLEEAPASVVLAAVLEETEYQGWISQSADAQADARLENIEELCAHAETYDREEPEGKLRGFLQDVALVSDVDVWEESSPKVTLMTLHASKGLEFPAVFVCGLEEELLPHARALQEGSLEEERRLFYVGMTRAMRELFLTHAGMRFHFGEASYRQPSRFLRELPAGILEGEDSPGVSDDDVLGAYDAPDHVTELRVGDRVEHEHFGYGVVENLQGSGINARVTVDFQGVGRKVLLVQYAKLEVVTP